MSGAGEAVFEVERKFVLRDVEHAGTIADCLLALGASLGEAHQQEDHYFRHPLRDFSRTDEALRLRRDGDNNFLTYKGPKLDTTTKTRQEIEIPLGDGASQHDQCTRLLEALGFQPVRAVCKKRRHYRLDFLGQNITIALDEVPGLGFFVEIEVLADASEIDQSRAILARLSEQLGLDQPERRSYLELLLESAGA